MKSKSQSLKSFSKYLIKQKLTKQKLTRKKSKSKYPLNGGNPALLAMKAMETMQTMQKSPIAQQALSGLSGQPIQPIQLIEPKQLNIEDKPTSKDIISLLKIMFHESWFQDQFLDILSKNLKTQYFNKIVETNIFNIFNNIFDNINKNDNIIITISILKNNMNYFEELLKQSIMNDNNFYDNTKTYPSDDNIFRIYSTTSNQYSINITKNFRNLLLPETNNPTAEEKNDEISTIFENNRAKYLLDLEIEKQKLEEEDKEYKIKKNKDRENGYNKMINQNIQARLNTDLDDNSIKSIMNFFNNTEDSIKNDDTPDNDGAIIINGEKYNEMIIYTICDCIKDMLTTNESTKEIINIILKRFDYMLKEFIDIMQNNGIIKTILIRIFDKQPEIFKAFEKGVENAINKKIEIISKTQAIGNAYIIKRDIEGDYAFFKEIINSVINELTNNNLEIFIPSGENPNDKGDTLNGGQTILKKNKSTISPTKKKIQQYLINERKTIKKTKNSGGWFW